MARYGDGFWGHTINHVDQEPMLAGTWHGWSCNDLLPSYYRGSFGLKAYEPQFSSGTDPYVLYNQFGQIVYQWPEGVEPTYAELDRICGKLMRGEVIF